jgi:hypothetical protein
MDNPKSNIFMSYSRREVPFVNNLVDDLEDQDYAVWLDYRSLIPGTPWAGQIDTGIADSDVILLVVSKASMASQYVEMEWNQVLKQGKRVIILIFEAVDLPIELESFEWVDFRGNYQNSLTELRRQLDSPELEEHPAPETGFRVPVVVWVAALLSVIIGLFSIGAIWTLFIPYLLLPLSYRVFKRNFNFTQTQAALIFLPLALFLSSSFVESDDLSDTLTGLAWGCVPFAVALILVLRSPGMQRWGKPVATLPKFANPFDPNNPNPEPISFFVDHAPEDQYVATELVQTLQEYGHPQVADIHQAAAVFVLISNYNKYTDADPQSQVVYPVILQTTEDIHDKLGKVQWIDFRSGIRDLHEIAQLLPNPAKLLKALGIRPMGNQMILPPVIQYLLYFIAALAIFTLGSWLPYVVQYLPEISKYASADGALILLVITLILFGALSFMMGRALVQRRGHLAGVRNLAIAMLVLGGIILWQESIDLDIQVALISFENEDVFRGTSVEFPLYVYLGGNFFMGLVMWLKRHDIRRWFPARVK